MARICDEAVVRMASLLTGIGVVAMATVATSAHAQSAVASPSPFATPKVQLGQASHPNMNLLGGLPKLSMPTTSGPPGTVIRRDYDRPMPNLSNLRYLRAGANTVIAAYFVWQQNWIGGREYIFPTRKAWSRNLKGGFEWDKDPIQTNFFGHPYNGSFYFTGARAAGLTFWESVPYTAFGSLVWELFSEIERPSMNDMFTTTFGGIILGEVLYRLSSQVLDESKSGWRRLGSELLAAGIAPLRGFDRLYTGQAWHSGPPGVKKHFEAAFLTGLERTNSLSFDNEIPNYSDDPVQEPTVGALLAAVQVRYGDWLPNERGTLDAFDAFNFYAAGNVTSRNGFQGVQIYSDALLHGWSSWITDDTGHDQDNNVLGFGASYDYQGLSRINLSGIGIGPTDQIIFRRTNGQRFQLGMDFQWVPILGTTSANTADAERDYNLAVGAAGGVSLQWDLARWGRLGLRARHYLGAVVSGQPGLEYTQYSRLWYEFDIVPKLLGLGVAPIVLSRYGRYDNGTRFRGNFDSVQFYVTLHN